MLERGVWVIAPGHTRLDALDQCVIDALQLVVLVLQPSQLGLQFSDRQEAGCGQWRPR